MEKCAGVTLTGKKCKKFVTPGDRFCYLHSKKSPKRSSPKRRTSSPKKSPSPKRRISSPKKSPSLVFKLDETLLPMLLDMKPDDLKQMCSVDRRINKMCNNLEFRRLYRLRWPKLSFLEEVNFVRVDNDTLRSTDGSIEINIPRRLAPHIPRFDRIIIRFVEKDIELTVTMHGSLKYIILRGPGIMDIVPVSQEDYDKSKWAKKILSDIGLAYLIKYGDKQVDYVRDGVEKLFEKYK